jgi:hypothetical protein
MGISPGLAVAWRRARAAAGPAWRAHGCFLVTALACVGIFGWMITYGTFRFVAEDVFGSFYDHQAVAWLHGRWDVPGPALSGEALIVGGKIYGYFGPTPALMRLPFVALGIGFARLTRLLMTFDFAACLVGGYALLRLAASWRDPQVAPSRWAIGLFTATVGLGSTVFFLGSRAYVYHEAILCGVACALVATYATLRYWQAPASRWWIGALLAGVLAVQARAPIGLFALSLLGVAALAVARANLRRHLAIAALAGAGVLSFNAVSYLKFGTIEGCPLRFNAQYNTPEKLAALGNSNFHLSNLRFNTDAYLLRPSFSLSPHFPYVYREYLDRKKYPESRMAYRDQTLAMPWSMPGLFVLALAGSILAARTRPALRAPLALLWIAAVPAALAMLTAVAVTQRYTADFCPFLIAAAAFGLVAIEAQAGRLRRVSIAIAATLGVLGVLITFALTLHNQREIVWGVPDDVRQSYQQFRAHVDGVFGVNR